MRTAVLVDGGFFRVRHRAIYGEVGPDVLANRVCTMAYRHINRQDKNDNSNSDDLYRILYYDCEPFPDRQNNPISRAPVFGKHDPTYKYMMEFFKALKAKRKVAVRLGVLKKSGGWTIKAQSTQEILKGRAIQADDLSFPVRQKGVDMRLGLDVSSLAYKRLVDKIVLIAGDADFVPAAKLARREGIDFVLDPMDHDHIVSEELLEHIDGKFTTCRGLEPKGSQNPGGSRRRGSTSKRATTKTKTSQTE